MMDVSVVIPSYNQGRFIAESVESALSQTLPPSEVIVVEDGSTDETSRVLSGFGSRVRTIHHSENRGLAATRNTGIAAASGDVVAFLDADDVWLPRKLELQVARLSADPGLGLVCCAVEEVDATGRQLSVRRGGAEGWIAPDLARYDGTLVYAAGSTAFVPRHVFDRVGTFDTALTTSQDWDLCFRIAVSYRVGFVPEVLVRYRIHGGGMHHSVELMERNMLLAFDKAFATDDPRIRAVRRLGYANLHTVLASYYAAAGHPWRCAIHAARAGWRSPRAGMRFLRPAAVRVVRPVLSRRRPS